MNPSKYEVIPEAEDTEDCRADVLDKEATALLVSSPMHLSPVEIPVSQLASRKTSKYWVNMSLTTQCNAQQTFLHVFEFVCPLLQCRISTYVWLLLGYPVLVVVHCLVCVLSWLLVFSVPVAKVNARTLITVLLMAPEDVHIHRVEKVAGHQHCMNVGGLKLCGCGHTFVVVSVMGPLNS